MLWGRTIEIPFARMVFSNAPDRVVMMWPQSVSRRIGVPSYQWRIEDGRLKLSDFKGSDRYIWLLRRSRFGFLDAVDPDGNSIRLGFP